MTCETLFGKKNIKRNAKWLKCAHGLRTDISLAHFLFLLQKRKSQNEEMAIRMVMKN
jgi:hypothetical protein